MGGVEAKLRLQCQYAKENLTKLSNGWIFGEVKVFGQFWDVYQSFVCFNHEHGGILKRDIFFSEEIQN